MTHTIATQLSHREPNFKAQSEIHSLSSMKLWERVEQILQARMNSISQGLLTPEQIKEMISIQINDILTNCYALDLQITEISQEEIEKICHDAEQKYLAQYFPDAQSIDDIKSTESLHEELLQTQERLLDEILDIEEEIENITKHIDEYQKINISLKNPREYNSISLNYLTDWDFQQTMNSLLECEFDIESIEDDSKYNQICSDIVDSEIFIDLLWSTFRVSRIPGVILSKKDFFKNIYNVSKLLENFDKIDDFETIWDILKYQENLALERQSKDSQLANLKQQKDQKQALLEENNNELSLFSIKEITQVNMSEDEYTKKNIQTIVDNMFTDFEKQKYDEHIKRLWSIIERRWSWPDVKIVLLKMIVMLPLMKANISNLLDHLQQLEKFIPKDIIESVLQDALVRTFQDNPISFVSCVFQIKNHYNIWNNWHHCVIPDTMINQIERLKWYDAEVMQMLIEKWLVIIKYTKKLNTIKDIHFWKKYEIEWKIAKLNSRLSKFIKANKKVNCVVFSPGKWQNSLIWQECYWVKYGNIDLFIKTSDITHLQEKINNTDELTDFVREYHRPLDIKLLEEIDSRKIKLFNIPKQEQPESTLSHKNSNVNVKNNHPINDTIEKLAAADFHDQEQYLSCVWGLKNYFNNIADESLSKSLWRKLLWFWNARWYIGIVLKNDLDLFRKYLENNNPDALKQVSQEAKIKQVAENEILADILREKKSKLEKRIFRLYLWEDYALKSLKNFDFDELLEYYNQTFIRHTLKDFERLMGIEIQNFDNKVNIKDPNASPFNYNIEAGTNIQEHWKLYKIIEWLKKRGITIEDGYNISTKSNHYICYIKEYNKILITSDSVWTVFIFDGNAINDVTEFWEMSLRELVKLWKWVEKKYNYADHSYSFTKIFSAIQQLDFWFFGVDNSQELSQEQLSIERKQIEDILDLFAELYEQKAFEVNSTGSVETFIKQWNADVQSLMKSQDASKFWEIIQQKAQKYNGDLSKLLMWNYVENKPNSFCNYWVDQLYFKLWWNIKMVRYHKWFTKIEKPYLDAMVALRLNPDDWEAKAQKDKLEEEILKNHRTSTVNKNALYRISKLDDSRIEELVNLYLNHQTVTQFDGIAIKRWIQSKVTLLIALWLDTNSQKSEIVKAINDYQMKYEIEQSILSWDQTHIDELLNNDFWDTMMSLVFKNTKEFLYFMSLDGNTDKEIMKQNFRSLQSVSQQLKNAIWEETMQEYIDNLSLENIDIQQFQTLRDKNLSDKILQDDIHWFLLNTDKIQLPRTSPKFKEKLNSMEQQQLEYISSLKLCPTNIKTYQSRRFLDLVAHKFEL